ncbi:hypothetical protein [Rachiplusia nu nucleopolyhedrovirus]|uniref:Uncharacterized protein n=1 Tax=Rachiplusia nu nucleopolyhedrovirus TaxID=2605775 RepID=A0AAF1DB65_9ABAC|nr:hypothetical protein QKQ55_gp127 [Rachiplusia nu nucleopolyhedrovirus]QEI03704.1 hypothetical protein [Rachiplusia nu nucleopolyhedrovirus]
MLVVDQIKCIDYSAYDIIKLSQLNTKCAKSKFKAYPQCEAQRLLENFNQQVFNFATPSEVERYAGWLKLMNKMQEYDAQFYLLDSVAKHSLRMASINKRISRKMQIVSSDVFIITAELYSRYVTSLNFRRTFASIQSLFDTFVVWDTEQLSTCLLTYAELRFRFEKNSKFVELIDRSAIQISKIALSHPLMLQPKHEIKQDIYMSYVSKFSTAIISADNVIISYDDTKFKRDMYEVIENVLFPYEMMFRIDNVTIYIHHNITRPEVLVNMRQENDRVYNTFRNFYKHLNIDYTHKIPELHMYVHNKRKNYIRTGVYWSYGINNGGITQYVPNSKQIRANVFFVDYEKDNLPNAYGHEFHHCLLFTLEARYQPKWYIEGSADRFGNSECYERDHEGLKAYRNSTIHDIVNADYQSAILYPMGSALVAYLYEMRPSILKSMILAQNYTIEIDDALETDFDIFKTNKIAQCDRYLSLKNNRAMSPQKHNTVQQQYLNMIDSETFTMCQNYIQVDFEDCAFILTPRRLIKQNKMSKHSTIVAQKEIRFNYEDVSQFDFEYLQKGIIKLAIKSLMPVNYTDHLNVAEKYFSLDSNYWYNGKLSCVNDTLAIVRFARASKFWLDLPMNNGIDDYRNTTLQQDSNFIYNVIQEAESCAIFVAPPNANTTSTLRDFALNVDKLQHEKISVQNLKKPLDSKNNTMVHLIAMYNHRYFNRLLKYGDDYRQLITNLVNADKNTPLILYYYSKSFLQKFGRFPRKYCFSFIKYSTNGTNNILSYKPTNTASEKSKTDKESTTTVSVITELVSSTTPGSNIKQQEQQHEKEEATHNFKETTHLFDQSFNFYYIVITIIVMVVGCIFLILVNIFTTLIVLKLYNKKKFS